MSAADRVQKFFEDAEKLVSTAASNTTNSNSHHKKMISEITKLRTWLQKHQDETISDGSKGKLFQLIQIYYKQGSSLKLIANNNNNNSNNSEHTELRVTRSSQQYKNYCQPSYKCPRES